MKKYIILVGLHMAIANIAVAHPAVGIEKANKVEINLGMSKKEKFHILKCLVVLKKHGSAEEAIEAKMAKIDKVCIDKNLDKEKCNHIKGKIAKGIHHCFLAAEFFKEYF